MDSSIHSAESRRGEAGRPFENSPEVGGLGETACSGDLVDVLFSPLTYLIGPASNLAIGTGFGLAELEARGPAMRALEESSVDYYAALRSAYLQTRAAQLRSRNRSSQ